MDKGKLMNYDFDRLTDRIGTASCKWDIKDNELPMWVADMDFETAPSVLSAIKNRFDNGIFSYSDVPPSWYDAYVGWWKKRHGYEMKAEWLMFCTGVIPAISSCVRKLTTPNENVLLLTPVYNIFYNSTINNGRRVLECPLRNEGGEYSIDFNLLEQGLSNPQTSLMIFCNPHNPVGRIWTAEEIAKVGELAAKHHVTVISDEIHCDLTEPGCGYVPFASVNETCARVSITCIAPTKAFNIAGLQTSAICVPDENLRHKVNRAINTDEVAEPNVFACAAAEGAFSEEGESWLEALRDYISGNRAFVAEFLERELPCIKITPQSATYLLWLDISSVAEDSEAFASFLREKTGLWITEGEHYGRGGKGFIRVNIATQRARVEDGMNRLKNGVTLWLNR